MHLVQYPMLRKLNLNTNINTTVEPEYTYSYNIIIIIFIYKTIAELLSEEADKNDFKNNNIDTFAFL